MKRLKRKLIASMCMLLVSAIMVTSTSFAWFTVSQQASAGDVKAQLMRTQNIEIAKAYNLTKTPPEVSADDVGAAADDTKTNHLPGREYYWGATIAFDLTTLGDLKLPAHPNASGDIQGVLYDTDGRTKGFYTAASKLEKGITIYSYDPFPDNNQVDDFNIAYGYSLYLRTNVDGNITCTFDQDAGVKGATISMKAYDCGTDCNATWTKSGSGTGSSSGFEAEANHIYFVDILVYFDGEQLTAADVAEGLNATMRNMTFTNDAFDSSDWNADLGFASAYVPADEFDEDNEKTYSLGEKVTYDGKTYKCTTAITTATKTWDATKWTEVYTANNKTVAAYNGALIYEKGTRVTYTYTDTNDSDKEYKLTYLCIDEQDQASGTGNITYASWAITVPTTAPGWVAAVGTSGEAGYKAAHYATSEIALTSHTATNYSDEQSYEKGDKLTGYDGGDLFCKVDITASSTAKHAWNPSEWALVPSAELPTDDADASDAVYRPLNYNTAIAYTKGTQLKLDDTSFVYAADDIAKDTDWDPDDWSTDPDDAIPTTLPDTAPTAYVATKGYTKGETIKDAKGYTLYCAATIAKDTAWATAKSSWQYTPITVPTSVPTTAPTGDKGYVATQAYTVNATIEDSNGFTLYCTTAIATGGEAWTPAHWSYTKP